MTGNTTRFWMPACIAFSVLLIGCGQADSDKIADAQACLDKATDSTALSCMEKVEGLTTPASDLIRCSAYFIDQGFSDPSRLSKISEQLKNKNGGSSSTISVLSFMAFSSQRYNRTQNDEKSELAFAACQRSLSSGLVYLSSMSRIATAALSTLGSYDPSSGTPPTETEVRDALCSNPSGPPPATAIVIGSAAQIAYEQNCKGKNIDDDPICKQYEEAIQGKSSPEDIGASLASNLCAP